MRGSRSWQIVKEMSGARKQGRQVYGNRGNAAIYFAWQAQGTFTRPIVFVSAPNQISRVAG